MRGRRPRSWPLSPGSSDSSSCFGVQPFRPMRSRMEPSPGPLVPTSSVSTRSSVSASSPCWPRWASDCSGDEARPTSSPRWPSWRCWPSGAAFLSQSTEYEPEIFSLLFGEILGVSSSQILPVADPRSRFHSRNCLPLPTATADLHRSRDRRGAGPSPSADRNGISRRARVRHDHDGSGRRGAPDLHVDDRTPGGGSMLHRSPRTRHVGLRASSHSLTVWSGIACSYETNWPVGFFVATFSAAWYGIGRAYRLWHLSHHSPRNRPVDTIAT